MYGLFFSPIPSVLSLHSISSFLLAPPPARREWHLELPDTFPGLEIHQKVHLRQTGTHFWRIYTVTPKFKSL